MNLAYKHLEAKLRVAELSLGQWAGIALGGLLAIAWGVYVSPFGSTLTLISAVYVGGLPAGAVVLAGVSELDVWLLVRSALAFRRSPGRYRPGPGTVAGYRVVPEPAETGERPMSPGALDAIELWER